MVGVGVAVFKEHSGSVTEAQTGLPCTLYWPIASADVVWSITTKNVFCPNPPVVYEAGTEITI
jgi:hypothetical protein